MRKLWDINNSKKKNLVNRFKSQNKEKKPINKKILFVKMKNANMKKIKQNKFPKSKTHKIT
jgi:hypothetical protein